MKSYFFISYAANEDRRWVQRFHADLEYELRVQVGPAVGGMLDTRPRDGMAADQALAAGAGSIRTMVALCSDPYFKDGWCGREWKIFGSRVENFSKAGATRLEDGFLQVRWRPMQDPVPAVAARELAAAAAGFPELYVHRGLLWLMRNMLLGAGGYYAFVRMFAARIVAAQQVVLDPLPVAAVRSAGPAFGSRGSNGAVSNGRMPAVSNGRMPAAAPGSGGDRDPAAPLDGAASDGAVPPSPLPPRPDGTDAPEGSRGPRHSGGSPHRSGGGSGAGGRNGKAASNGSGRPPISASPMPSPPMPAPPRPAPPMSSPPMPSPPMPAPPRPAPPRPAALTPVKPTPAPSTPVKPTPAKSTPAKPTPAKPTAATPATSRRVTICYVGANQEWADWLEQLLRGRSHHVFQIRWAQSGGERLVRAVDRVVASAPDVAVFLLSRHYRPPRPEEPGTTEIEAWEQLGPDGPLGARVIRVVIDREPLPEPLRDLPRLDLSRLEPKSVGALLMTVQAGARS